MIHLRRFAIGAVVLAVVIGGGVFLILNPIVLIFAVLVFLAYSIGAGWLDMNTPERSIPLPPAERD